MFPLHFDFGSPGASIAVRCALGRRFGAYSVRLDGLRFDNRFVPFVSGAKRQWRLIIFAVRGSLVVRGERVPPGSVIVAPQTVMSTPDASHRISSIDPSTSLSAIRILPEALVDADAGGVRVLRISSAAQRAFRDLVEPTERGQTEEAFRRASWLVDNLITDGIAHTRLLKADEQEGRTLAVRTVEAVFPLLSALAKQPMLVDIASRAGIGERQVLRNILKVQSDFDLLDRGWREAIVRWRVTAAVLLLSSDKLSLHDVAELAGYSGTKTLARALSDAGLPPANVIRTMLRADQFERVE